MDNMHPMWESKGGKDMKEEVLIHKMYSGLTEKMLNICSEMPEMTTRATINAVCTLLGSLLVTAPTKNVSLKTLAVAVKYIKEYIEENWLIAEAMKGGKNDDTLDCEG